MKTILSTLGISFFILTSCGGQKKVETDFIQDNIDNAVAQHTLQTDLIEASGEILNPRTVKKDGSISYIPIDDWCSGFFPGNMWLTYKLTGDEKWLPLAVKYTEALDSVKYLKWHHGSRRYPVVGRRQGMARYARMEMPGDYRQHDESRIAVRSDCFFRRFHFP